MPEEVLRLNPEPVAQDVDVADEHEVRVVGGGQSARRERGVDGIRDPRPSARRRERGLERPFEARGEDELFAARREAFRSSSGSEELEAPAGIASDSTLDLISGVSFAVALGELEMPCDAEVDGAKPR